MQFEDHELERMRKDPGNYKWGIFYFNPKDPRVILPKRNKILGITVNFASPYSYLIIIAIVAFAVIMDYLF